MYTNGIRKVFDPDIAKCWKLEDATAHADAAEYTILTFNGDIWIKSPYDHRWHKSTLRIEDFEVK